VRIERFAENPIIVPNMDARMGTNVNGPSLIRVPEWVENPLGKYYLYFGHHKGQYIRLAYADRLEGPWRTYEPGTLQLEESVFRHHIASPDVHVDEERREIRMYYHGVAYPEQREAHSREKDGAGYGQLSACAVAKDGLQFEPVGDIVGSSYPRAFQWQGFWYVLTMPGHLQRSLDGLSAFETGPTLFDQDFRHAAVKVDGDTLSVFFSRSGDCPERLLLATVEMTDEWLTWQATAPATVLEPAMGYEGADLPVLPSKRGWAPSRVRQLRDPAIYREEDATYLLYSVAGEAGIAIARLHDD